MIDCFCAAACVILAFSLLSHTFYAVFHMHECESEFFRMSSCFHKSAKRSLISFMTANLCTFYSRCQFNFLLLHHYMLLCSSVIIAPGGTIRFYLQHLSCPHSTSFHGLFSDSFPPPVPPFFLFPRANEIRIVMPPVPPSW